MTTVIIKGLTQLGVAENFVTSHYSVCFYGELNTLLVQRRIYTTSLLSACDEWRPWLHSIS